MVPYKTCLVVLLLQTFFIGAVVCGRVLIWPADASHWINIKPIMEQLVNKGHSITVLVHSASVHINPNKPSPYKFEVFTVPFSRNDLEATGNKLFNFWIYESRQLSYWQLFWTFLDIAAEAQLRQKQVCDGILGNKNLLEKLQETQFDVLLADPVYFCGELVAAKLTIPFIYTLRLSVANTLERLCGQLPAPPSFVPASMTGFTDKMGFTERMQNFLFYLVHDVMFSGISRYQWSSVYSEHAGKPTTLCETMGKAEMWLIRTYWDFEYPRPYLPNFEFVGGLHCQPAKPLPEELEEFVQSSGDDGIVVFSLGSMIKNLTKEKANVIASALAQIPQKVLWRYSGESPDTLGPNTKLLDWLPQNDLLGHPKTKLFITHGGTNGIYEAIYHGVPMVGIPLFADQPDNMVHMKAKGAAEVVDFTYLKTQDLLEAINKVISDAKYKESAMKLSQIQHDQPVKPLDRAVFWIEFVMRHKGAKHLRPASHNLTWYQYHCLDVISFLLFCLAAALFITVKCCILCFRKSVRLLGTKDKRE